MHPILRHAPLVFITSAIAIFAAVLGMQYGGDYYPCDLCIRQRVPWALILLIGAGAYIVQRRGRHPARVRWLVGLGALVFLVSAGLGVQHVGVEQHWWPGPGCTAVIEETGSFEEWLKAMEEAPIVRCDEVLWSLFGISLAGYNAILSLLLAGYAGLAAWKNPWRRRATA